MLHGLLNGNNCVFENVLILKRCVFLTEIIIFNPWKIFFKASAVK